MIHAGKFFSTLRPASFQKDTKSQLELANLIFLNPEIISPILVRWPLRAEIKLHILQEIHTNKTSAPLISVSFFEKDYPLRVSDLSNPPCEASSLPVLSHSAIEEDDNKTKSPL